MLQDAFGIAGAEGREFEIGARLVADRVEISKAQHPVGLHDHRGIDIEFLAQQRLGLFVALLVQFEQDRSSPAAALNRGAEIAHAILGLFLDLDIAVSQHPEHAVA